MENNYVISIGRQLGSGGREVGEKLANRLGITFYDKELLKLASEESGLCPECFEKVDERPSSGFMGGLISMRIPFVSEGAMPLGSCLDNDSLFKVQSDVIRQLANEKSCLFVGRCADYILRDHPRCLNVFISATIDDRITRICDKNGITPQEARNLIEKADKRRAEYYNYYSNKRWGRAESYHLCINSSQLGIDATVEFIESFIRKTLQITQ